MRLTHIDQLEVGMALAEPIYGGRGQLMLAPDVKLTERYIEMLRKLGIPAAYIADPDTSGISVPQPLKARTRAVACAQMTDVFDRLVRAAKEFQKKSPGMDQRTGCEHFARQARSVLGGGFDALVDCTQTVMADLLDQHVLIGLNSIKTHDAYTFQHSIDVTVLGVMLAKKAGWDAKNVRLFGIGCMLHDIGKVLVPEELLTKSGRLTAAEFELMKQHPETGYRLIKCIAPSLGALAPQVAYQHHERQDGSGYPRGLRGNNTMGNNAPGLIHDFGALAAVADVYDAMSSVRPYRQAWAPDEVVQSIIGLAGEQLNRDAVAIFKSVVAPYPVCSEVQVVTGRYAGHRGVVASVNPADLSRPKIRVLHGPQGKRIEPFEIDLRRERDVVVRSSTAGDELPAESMGGRRQKPRAAQPLPEEVIATLRQTRGLLARKAS